MSYKRHTLQFSAADQLQEITKIVFKEEDGGGLCVTFRSKEFSCFIIGYPDDGYVVKGNVSRLNGEACISGVQ